MAAPLALVSANMTAARIGHSSTLLPDGRVLIAGGSPVPFDPLGDQSGFLTSMEIFDPATEAFYPCLKTDGSPATIIGTPGDGGTPQGRAGHAAVLLDSGLVLFLGGGPSTTETFNPVTGESVVVGNLPGISQEMTAFNVGGGKVLTYGHNNTLVYPPMLIDTTTWAATILTTDPHLLGPTDAIYTACSPASVLLQNGRVMVSGGSPAFIPDPTGAPVSIFVAYHSAGVSQNDVSMFDSTTATFVHVGSMLQARTGHTMIDLGNGTVQIYGGYADSVAHPGTGTPLTSVEIFNYASKTSPIPLNTSVKVGDLIGGKYLMESVLLQNGFAAAVQSGAWQSGLACVR